MSDEREPVSGGPASGPFASLGATIDNLLRNLVPSNEACDHFANARLEVLKGIRALVEARIDRLSTEGRKGVEIKIE